MARPKTWGAGEKLPDGVVGQFVVGRPDGNHYSSCTHDVARECEIWSEQVVARPTGLSVSATKDAHKDVLYRRHDEVYGTLREKRCRSRVICESARACADWVKAHPEWTGPDDGTEWRTCYSSQSTPTPGRGGWT